MFDWRSKDDQFIIRFATQLQASLETERAAFEPMYNAAIRLYQPRRYDLQQSQSLSTAELRSIAYGVRVFDATPAMSLRKFGTSMAGNMVSREDNDPFWIQFTAPNQRLMEIDIIKQRLQEAQEQVRFGFNQSSFYRELPQFLEDAGCTYGVMTAKRDLVNDRIVFQTRHPGTYWFHTNDFGDIDADHFKLKMTAYDLIQQFGDNPNFPASIKEDHDGVKDAKDPNPFKTYDVLHVTYKNQSRRAGSLDASDKEWIQFYIVMNCGKSGKDKVIVNGGGEEAGVDWRPITLRRGTVPGLAYPLSLALDGLTSATYGNKIAQYQLLMSAHGSNPMALVHDKLRKQVHDTELNPGARIYTNDLAKHSMEFMVNTSQTAVAEFGLEKITEITRDVFFLPFFEMLTGTRDAPQRTAFEVSQMVQEKIPELTPVMESAEDAVLEPASEIIWIYETEAGRMPTMPEELFQGSRKVQNKYMGRFAQLKRSLREATGSLAQIQIMEAVGRIYPNALRIIRSEKFLEDTLIAHGGKQDHIFDEQDIRDMDAQAAAEEERDRQLAIGAEAGKILPPGKAVEPNSPLALAS